jgi:hypothetical protein
MTPKTASVSGNWSSTATWGGAAVPVDGDAVIINSGITVTMDVNQSGFANGLLSMDIEGILTFKVDSVTYLKMNGNITGAGQLIVGTSANPIQRPTAGSESRCQLIFNSTGTINLPNISMYGWYPSLEYTTLSANANSGQPTIVLNDDLGLQQGDIIVIGSGAIAGYLTESQAGIYTVQSYVASTKTVTLTANLGTHNRLAGDYVGVINRPIKISRTSGTAAFISVNTNPVALTGVRIESGHFMVGSGNNAAGFYAGVFNHCSSATRAFVQYAINATFNNCVMANYQPGSIIFGTLNVTGCLCINTSSIMGYVLNNGIITNSVGQNNVSPGANGTYNNCIIKNCRLSGATTIGGAIIKNSNVEVFGIPTASEVGGANLDFPITYINCHLKGSTTGIFNINTGKAYNCIFDNDPQMNEWWRSGKLLESFDHNQIIGNYAAWMKGGSILTQTVSSTPQPGKLTFNPVSSTIPVYRDFNILAPANRTIRELIMVNKSFSGGTVALQIIDPANDPLIDSTQTPLVQSTLPDTPSTNLQLGIAYKSSVAKELILRILVQNGSGTANIDVTRIQQSFQKPRQLI